MSNPNKKLLQVFAHYYHSMGMNILPVYQYKNEEGKLVTAPFRGAKALRSERQSFGDLLEIKWHKCIGIGSVCGYENWRCLEFQNSEDIDFVRQLMEKLGLPLDYPWLLSHKKKNGFQLWFKTDKKRFPFKKTKWVFLPLETSERYFKKLYLYWERTPKLPVTLKVHIQDEATTFKHLPTGFPAIVKTDVLKTIIEQLCVIPETETAATAVVPDEVIEEENETTRNKKEQIERYLFLNLFLNEEKEIVEKDSLEETVTVIKKTKRKTKATTEIVQIAWSIYDKKGNFIEEKQQLIKPNFDILPSVLKQLGLTQEEVKKQGRPLKSVLQELVPLINQTTTLLAHGLERKLAILDKVGQPAKIAFEFDKKKHICTEKKGLEYCGVLKLTGYYPPNLQELHRKLYYYQLVPELYEAPKSDTIKENLDLMITCFWEMRKQLLA